MSVDPVAEVREALEEAMHFTFLQDGEQECREEIQRALSALSKLHTERRWPCGCEERISWTGSKAGTYWVTCKDHRLTPPNTPATTLISYLLYDSEPTTRAQE